jgi:hypothetical protein
MEPFIGITILLLFVGFIVVMRLLGAWLLRINEVLQNQRTIISELRYIIDTLKNN